MMELGFRLDEVHACRGSLIVKLEKNFFEVKLDASLPSSAKISQEKIACWPRDSNPQRSNLHPLAKSFHFLQ